MNECVLLLWHSEQKLLADILTKCYCHYTPLLKTQRSKINQKCQNGIYQKQRTQWLRARWTKKYNHACVHSSHSGGLWTVNIDCINCCIRNVTQSRPMKWASIECQRQEAGTSAYSLGDTCQSAARTLR